MILIGHQAGARARFARVCGFLALAGMLLAAAAAPAQAQDDRRVPRNQAQVQLSYAPLVKRVAPAVVNIYTKQVVEVQQSPFFNDPFFRRFFGEDNPFSVPRERVQGALGSGVIVRADGIIVTNNHVVGNADEIRVVLADRREYDAEILLADERTDLAVLKIELNGQSLPFLDLADSDDIEVGDIVLAIGNPLGLGQTVTSGIVSATARTQVGASNYQFYIQTDASVNPGNSGGALVGLDGKLAGINTLILSQSGGSIGLGFAIPSNMVESVVHAAVEGGHIVRPWLGASGQAVTADIAESLGLDRPGGVLIDSVTSKSPAAKAGIKSGDVILAVNGKEVVDPQGLSFRVATAPSDRDVDILVFRDGRRYTARARLTAPPENPPRNVTLLDGRHPFQGVTVGNLNPRYADELGVDPQARGVIVASIDRRAPAWRRQFLRPGDIIMAIGEISVNRVADLTAYLSQPHDRYVYRLKRGGRVIECGILNGGQSFYCR